MMGIRIIIVGQDQEILSLLGLPEEVARKSLLIDVQTLKKCCVHHLLRCGKMNPALARSNLARGGDAVTQARTPVSSSFLRRAWIERECILTLDNRDERIQRFLTVAIGQKRGAVSVSEAAAEVGMSVRQLNREVVGALRFPPLTVLRIARVANVIQEITASNRPLTSIALEHGYRDVAGMDRQFSKIVGISPSVCRERSGLSQVRIGKANV